MSSSRDGRLTESARKIRAPFELDPSLRFYSPQENLEGMDHPQVAAWQAYIRKDWQPESTPRGSRRVALMIPCTKYKPYSTSREHRAINRALLAGGWRPKGVSGAPGRLEEALDEEEGPDLLYEGTLRRGRVHLDRFVMSEPLGLVPYEHIYYWDGEQSPAASYDDPGLFESRGTSVSPDRADCTATPIGNGRWRWGPAEREAYVETHNQLVEVISDALTRLEPNYAAMAAWVSPGLTHRSFLADSELRREEGLPLTRNGTSGPLPLEGVLDRAPGLIAVMPTQEQLEDARRKLAVRLESEGRKATPQAVRAVYARGDGNDTPLGLPETLAHLTKWLDEA